MNATETKICPECFGEKKVENLPGIFENCSKCCAPVAMNIRPVTSELKKSFKIWCLDKGLSMKDAIIALVKYALENDPDLTKGEK